MVCTAEYRPVCGVDEKTYGNLCTMKSSGVDLAYDGECKINSIDSDMVIPNAEKSEIISMKPCTRDYRPVCGLDTVTYANLCVLKNNEAVFSHHGQCVGPKETGSVLFQNVNIFDGTSDTLQLTMNVLVEGNKIK